MGIRWQPAVEEEWGLLRRVALVRPDFFKITKPVNTTQRNIYGTNQEPNSNYLCCQHDAVRDQLISRGVEVHDIPPDERFPMQFNVRDAGFIIGSKCVLGRMACEARYGEPNAVKGALGIEENLLIPTSGTLEGGDVTVTRNEIFVGLSGRTDKLGIEGLQQVLPEYRVSCIPLVNGALHLDMVMNLVGPTTGIVHCKSLKEKLPDSLKDIDWIEVTDNEYLEAGANILSISPQTVMLDVRHERIADQLQRRGFECIPLELSEIGKVGGGIRCMTFPLVRS